MAHAESISRIDDRAVREIVEIQPELAFEGKRPHACARGQAPPRHRRVAGCSPHLERRVLYADSFAEEPPKDADIGTLRKRLLPYLEFFEDRYFTGEQTG